MDGSEPQQAVGGQAARDLRAEAGAVLQVEKHDYTDLRPHGRAPAQGMAGFDPIYTDIVDYIIRCTHRIWDEKNVGLIYSHYAHNAVVYSPLGTSYSREEVVRATLQRIAEHPERRGLGTQVIWGGNDVDGFYTSHLITSVGRFTAPGPYGMPTGKTFYSRAIADCMVFRNRIYREWLVRDNMAHLLNLGVDPDAVAAKMAAEQAARGVTAPALAMRPACWARSRPPSASTPPSPARRGKRHCCKRCTRSGTGACSAGCGTPTRRTRCGTARGCATSTARRR